MASEWLDQAQQFIVDYWLILAVIFILIAVTAIRRILETLRAKRDLKKMLEAENAKDKAKQLQAELERTRIAQRQHYQSTNNEVEEDFQRWFRNGGVKKPQNRFAIKDIEDTIEYLCAEDRTVNENMEVDVNLLRQKIADIINKKEQIKKYGMQLANLFDRYEERERQLTLMLAGMQDLVKKPEIPIPPHSQ